jgi:MFS transporter, FSR family, fosmidomycin resistance protein
MIQKTSIIPSNLAVYGTAHAVVDAACAGILFSILNEQTVSITVMAYLFILYNLLAFGLQLIIGFFVDVIKAPRLSALLGFVFTAIATLIFLPLPIAAVIFAGAGNALFHVGGGIISLSLTPRKATAPGIFVAPGALGLMVGTLLGRNGHFIAWPFLLVMAVLSVMIFLIAKPAMYQKQAKSEKSPEFKFEYILYLVLFVIAVRALGGLAVVFPWKSDINLLVILTISIALGKGLGGFIADKFGWAQVTIGSLIISIPLLIFGVSIPALGMMGMLLFNITMPVTLTMVSNMIPGRPGTAFGLTCMALLLGTLPAFTELNSRLNNSIFIIIIIAISAAALYLGLRYYQKAQLESGQKADIMSSIGLRIKPEERE